MEERKIYITKKTANGFDNVRVAIIQQAVSDLKQALRRYDSGKIKALENWFMSEWGEMLSGGNGAYIIEKVKKEVYKCPKVK